MNFSHLHELIRLFASSTTFENKHLKHLLHSTEDESLHTVCLRQNLRHQGIYLSPRSEITDGSKESERSTAISPAESSGRYMATANDSVWIFTWLSSCFLSNKEPLFILSWRPSLNCLFGWAIVWIIVTFLSRRSAFEWFRGRMTTALS